MHETTCEVELYRWDFIDRLQVDDFIRLVAMIQTDQHNCLNNRQCLDQAACKKKTARWNSDCTCCMCVMEAGCRDQNWRRAYWGWVPFSLSCAEWRCEMTHTGSFIWNTSIRNTWRCETANRSGRVFSGASNPEAVVLEILIRRLNSFHLCCN